MTGLQTVTDKLDTNERWIVQVTLATKYAPTERQLDAMANLAEQRDITVANRGNEPGMVFTADVTSADIGEVPGWAFAVAEQACGYSVAMPVSLVDLHVATPEVYEAETLRPDTPELLAATDIAELLGVSRQRVHQLHSDRTDFPAPYVRLGSGPVWTRPAVEAFDRVWTRKPGRPAKAS